MRLGPFQARPQPPPTAGEPPPQSRITEFGKQAYSKGRERSLSRPLALVPVMTPPSGRTPPLPLWTPSETLRGARAPLLGSLQPAGPEPDKTVACCSGVSCFCAQGDSLHGASDLGPPHSPCPSPAIPALAGSGGWAWGLGSWVECCGLRAGGGPHLSLSSSYPCRPRLMRDEGLGGLGPSA